jgi:hypothetical protein
MVILHFTLKSSHSTLKYFLITFDKSLSMKNEPDRPYGSKTDLPLLFDPAARRGRPHARLHQGPNGGVGGAGGRDGYGACTALHAHVHPHRGHHRHVGPFAHGLHDPKTC